MDRWAVIRRSAAGVLATFEARVEHQAFGPNAGSYRQLAEIARELYQLTVAPDDELPEGVSGRLNLDEGTIGYRADQSEVRRNFTVAHELGHRALRHPPREILDTDEHLDEVPDVGALTVRDGVYRAYGERDRWELGANVFAAELLAPVERVRAAVLATPDWTVGKLATYFGLSRAAMLNQLAAALLPGPAPEPAVARRVSRDLDARQRDAVQVPSPALVIAGPGAGKTLVLTRRFAHLVDRGTEPSRILALTFSNKAAEEIRERLVELLPQHAHAIQVMTFHALGLELLQGYGQEVRLKPDPKLLTELDAFVFLRSRLGELPLGSFEDLYRPTSQLGLLLGAISRAKDELVDPDEFERRVADWHVELAGRPVSTDDAAARRLEVEQLEAARCADVAAVYAVYQAWLREAGYLDYGDLIAEAVRLFTVPAVAAKIRGGYDYLLVDEFQDINYASGRLVHALDGGRGIVWAVGDPRQSIYRFRGASPVNLRNFVVDYPGARVVTLETNYRSVEDVVKAGQAVRIPQPSGGTLEVPNLRSDRGRLSEEPALELVVAPTGRDEVATLVERVGSLVASRPRGDIAVLCRTGPQAQEVSEALEQRRIPTDWGGALEKQGTFKDLVGVLFLAADNTQGLVRLARLPEHHLEEADLRTLLNAARARGHSAQAALYAAVAGEVEGLSEAGRFQAERLRRLAGELGHEPTPWHVLASYLFQHATWPRHLFGDTSPEAGRRLAALGQIAGLAREFAGRTELAGGSDVPAFLDYLGSCMEAGELGSSDEALVAADGVHVLTVHHAKGLEWPVVFVPNLAEGRFPTSDNHPPLPLPPGLIRGADPLDDEIEEACLFYVAVTRARDQVVLSRAERYGRSPAAPSPLLAGLTDSLTSAGYLRMTVAPIATLDAPAPPLSANQPWRLVDEVSFRHLETYERCPQAFKYERVYRLRDEDRGSLAFHAVVYNLMGWLAERAFAGEIPDTAAVDSELAARWEELGPSGHWFEAAYRRRAEQILRAFAGRLRPHVSVTIRGDAWLDLGGRTLKVTIDEVEDDGSRRIYRRHHFGDPAKSHQDEHRPALFVALHRQAHRDAPFEVRLYYPLSGRDKPVAPTKRVVDNRTTKMAKLVVDIEAGQFGPRSSSYSCPTCPYVFLCPA